MKRNIIIFGLILGLIMTVNMVYMANLCYTNPNFESNDILGYTAMVLMFSLIFFGVRNYRNKELNGQISFGKAFKTGALIALVGSTMYVGVWLLYYYLVIPDYLDKYTLHVLAQATRDGATTTQLAERRQDMENFRELYKTPVFVILITYAEVLPIGLVVALISALALKRK